MMGPFSNIKPSFRSSTQAEARNIVACLAVMTTKQDSSVSRAFSGACGSLPARAGLGKWNMSFRGIVDISNLLSWFRRHETYEVPPGALPDIFDNARPILTHPHMEHHSRLSTSESILQYCLYYQHHLSKMGQQFCRP